MQTSSNLASSGMIAGEIIPPHCIAGYANSPVTQGIWLAVPCWNFYHWNLLVITDITTCETIVHLIAAKSYLGTPVMPWRLTLFHCGPASIVSRESGWDLKQHTDATNTVSANAVWTEDSLQLDSGGRAVRNSVPLLLRHQSWAL